MIIKQLLTLSLLRDYLGDVDVVVLIGLEAQVLDKVLRIHIGILTDDVDHLLAASLQLLPVVAVEDLLLRRQVYFLIAY